MTSREGEKGKAGMEEAKGAASLKGTPKNQKPFFPQNSGFF